MTTMSADAQHCDEACPSNESAPGLLDNERVSELPFP
jgi:hypothetical protein